MASLTDCDPVKSTYGVEAWNYTEAIMAYIALVRLALMPPQKFQIDFNIFAMELPFAN